MESSVLTSPAAISRLTATRTLNNCNCSPLISQFHRHFTTRPSTHFILLSQLARLRLRAAVTKKPVQVLNRFGPVSRSLVAASLRPVRKDLRSVSSSAASFAAGGGGNDSYGGNGGGGGGNGDGATDGSKENASVAVETSEDVSSDVIILDVSGMTCGGCAASVKRILESQPQVSSATVNLTTETAIVWPVSDAKVVPDWQKQLGEALAKHLTTCGFKSNVRERLVTLRGFALEILVRQARSSRVLWLPHLLQHSQLELFI